MNKFKSMFLYGTLLLILGAICQSSAQAGSYVLTATADGTIAEDYPTSDYTAATTLEVITNNSGNAGFGRQGIVKFDIAGSGLNAEKVYRARLRLYVDGFNVTGGGADPFTLEVFENTLDWDESAGFPTWNSHNAAYGSTVEGSMVLDGNEVGTWIEIDIDLALVKGWLDGSINNYGVQLYGNNTYWRTKNPIFSSKEGANAPQLLIDTSDYILPATADATITEQYPTQDASAWTTVQVITNNGGNAGFGEQGMVKFDLSGSGLNAAQVVSARLRLHLDGFNVTGGGANTFSLEVRENTLDFDEGAGYPTWNTHSAAYGSTVDGSMVLDGNEAGWIEIDIAPALVKGWIDGSINNYGMQLYGNNSNWRTKNPYFSSKEGVNAPQLLLDISPDYIYTASADATITEPYPAQDASGWTTVRTITNNGGNAGNGEQGVVKFDLSGSGLNAANVTGAKLRLYVDGFVITGGGANPFSLEVRENILDWDEDANYPTWNTHNTAYGSTLEGSIVLDGNEVGSWVEMDIDLTLVKGWLDGSINNYGVQLYGNNNYWRTKNPYFSSKEGANAPQLVIAVSNDYVYLPTADATITEQYPVQDASAWTTIPVMTNNGGNVTWSGQGMVKFDLSGSLDAASVASAKLRLYADSFNVTGGGTHTFDLEALRCTADWDEDANYPTWNTHNTAHGNTIHGSIVLDGTESPGWIEVDVNTALVKGWLDGSINNYGMQLYGNNSYWRTKNPVFSSREGANAPQLVITPIGLKVWNPNPGDGDANLSTDVTLSWSSGKYADSHDVYFGDDANAVAAAQRQSADFDGSSLIDLGDIGVLAGQWLGSGTANLNGDGTVDMADFSIIAGSWQLPGDVTFMGNQTANNFDTGTLSIAKTYYWRIDEVNEVDNSITAGDVWAVHAAYDLNTAPNSVNPLAVSEVLAGKRTIANASWWGFNGTDDTNSIQGAIDSGAQKVIVPYMGSNWNVRPITLRSNQDIYFEPSVVVMAKLDEFHGTGDVLFSALSRKNIKFHGDDSSLVTLQMRKNDYMDANNYTPSEGRTLLTLVNCRNVQFSGLTLKDSGGDCVYINDGNGITISDVVADNPLRNGLSVIDVENLLIEDSVFKNASTGPMNAGIDFEPDAYMNELVNCVVRNCTFANNDGGAIMMLFQNTNATTGDVSISIEDCNIISGNNMGIGIAIPLGSVLGGSIDFSGCTIANTAYEGLAVWHEPDSVISMSFTDCDWNNVGSLGTSTTGSGFMNCGDPNCITVPDAIVFSNCFITGRDVSNPSLIPVDLESSSGVTIVP